MSCPNCGDDEAKEGQGCPQCGNYVPKEKSWRSSAPSDDAMPSGPGYETNGLAIVSLVLGIFGLVACLAAAPLGLLAGVVGIITGHMAKGRIRLSEGRERGGGLATAGLVLSYLLVAGGLALLLGIGGATFFGDRLRGNSADALAPDGYRR